MEAQLVSTLGKLAVPLAVIACVLFVARRRGIAWNSDRGLGLCWPPARVAAPWILLWIVWMALGEVAIAALGMEQPARWPDYPPLIFGLRVVAIGIAGPACEELLIRGLVFQRLRDTRLGPGGTIAITAAAWAALHIQYDPSTIAFIFLDGLVLGLARVRSRSVPLPLAMHSLANLFSIWQSTHA